MPDPGLSVSHDAIRHLAPDTLRPWTGNARTHSKKQIRQIADSIRTFGFTNPVLIDEGNRTRRTPRRRPRCRSGNRSPTSI